MRELREEETMRGMSADHRYLAHTIAWCADSFMLNREPSQRPHPIRASLPT